MKVKLEELVEEVSERTTVNNQHPVLTSSRSGIYLQEEYFKKQVASKDNTGYRIIRKGEFTYRAMSDTGEFYPNKLECTDIGIVSPAYPVFKIKDNRILPDYLKYYFKSRLFQKSITAFVQGSTRASMKFGKMKLISIDLPDKDKQNQILNIIGILESIIDKYELEIDRLNNLIKARFVEMFDSSKTYPIRPLSDIAEYWNGLTYKPTDVSDGGTIVLRSSNIQNMQLDLDDIVRVKCDISNKKIVKKNDILMCSRNGSAKLVGKVALIPNLPEQMSFGAFMMIIRSEYCQYLMTYFQLPEFRSQISTGTTTINQITRYMLDKVKLPVPDKASIDEFFTFVTQVDKSKFALSNELAMCNFYVRLINDSITHSRIDLRMSE